MSIPHAQSSDVIDLRPLEDTFDRERTTTLVKTESVELIRLVLPAGKSIAEHQVPGEITLQCIEGKVHFTADGSSLSGCAAIARFGSMRESFSASLTAASSPAHAHSSRSVVTGLPAS